VSEVEEFLKDILPRQIAAEIEVHNGKVGPRLAMWSHNDPVTVFGTWRLNSGWEGVSDAISNVAATFSDCKSYDFEVHAAGASGDLAYTVGFEPTTCSVNGVEQTYTLRVTNIYRREDGEWKLVHRHADRKTEMNSTPSGLPDSATKAGYGRPA
jgi:ketosteroid isomerase-like protein